jgi:hypothetical protein
MLGFNLGFAEIRPLNCNKIWHKAIINQANEHLFDST